MLSIGIDVSKGKSTVCGMKPGGEIVYAPFEVQHTREEMLELVSLLRSSGEEVRAVMESTGSYHCPVVAALLENGIFVSVVNSLRMKRFCSQSIRKVKTDRIDAMQIALYGLAYWQELQPTRLPEDTYRELQLLARQYYQMTSLLIKAKVDFNAICDQVLPGMQELMNDHAGRHKLSDFVLRYHHTTHILEMGETRFRKDYCKWAEKKGYRNCERMAALIFATAQNGIPVLPNAPSTQIVITEAIRVLHTVEASRDAIIISDTDDTFNFLASMVYTQLFNLLCDKADDVYGGRLPVHVRCLIDECANIGQIPKLEKLMATIRSREISACLVLQAQSQLKALYKDNCDTIIGNCDSSVFLGGKEPTTLKELSAALGKETIDTFNTGESRGREVSHSLNYQKLGKELMSQDELAVMNGGKCILQLRGVRPFLSDKYDITKHPNYKYLSDANPKNAFDIEKFLSTKLKLKPEEEFEVFDAGAAAGSESA